MKKEGSGFLTLTRKIGEKVVVNGNIVLTVVDIDWRGGQRFVKIGVEAPRSIRVDREEVRILREQQQQTATE